MKYAVAALAAILLGAVAVLGGLALSGDVVKSSPAPCLKPTTFLAPNDTEPIVLQATEFGRAVIEGKVQGHGKFQDQGAAAVELVSAPVQTPTKVVVQVLVGSPGDAMQYWALTFTRSCDGQDFKLVKAQEAGSQAAVPLPPTAS